MTKKSIACNLLYLLTMLAFPTTSRAANITLQGEFTADDDVQLFSVFLSAPAAVDLRSYGYAGGPTSAGISTQRGGFDSILTLFDASGTFLDDNDEGNGVATDPFTGLAADARITANLAAGKYILVLTQYDNFSLGNLTDGFLQTGFPNFTADPGFTAGDPCAGNLFRDISGTAERCRTGSWTVDLINVTSAETVAPVPEPATFLLAGLGLGVLLLVSRAWNVRKRSMLAGGFLAALAVGTAHAQAPPDYSNMSDFLKGQRSLLKVTDLHVVSYNANADLSWVEITTSNSQQTNGLVNNAQAWPFDQTKQLRTYSAYMFAQSSAVTITPIYNFQQSALLTFLIQNVVPLSTYTWTPLPEGDEPDIRAGAVADFTLNGYDDLALSTSDGRMILMTPIDLTDAGAGCRMVVTQLDVLTAMTAGDFNGDGKREIAGLTVLPSGGLKLVIYSVDSVTLAVTTASSFILKTPDATASTPVLRTSIARGRFNGAGHDQLAVAFATATSGAYVEVIDFNPGTLDAIEGPQHKATLPGVTHEGGYIEVKTGQFGLPANPFDQIVYHNSTPTTASGSRFFQVASVDPVTFAITAGSAVLYDQLPCAAGIEVGNFDHRQTDPLKPGQTEVNLNSQIALMYCTSAGPPNFAINIYSPDPATLALSGPDSINLTPVIVNNSSVFPAFVATDVQGRSLILGEPTILDMNSVAKPSVVVGAPPMHADFISSDPVSNVKPALLNLSAVWEGFKTTYDNETSDQHPTTDSQKTSWSFGAKESFGYKAYVGDIESTGFQASDTFTAAQKLKGSTDTINGTYQAHNFSLSATSGFGDLVMYKEFTLRIWVYPVIGRTVCPSSKPKCDPTEQVPLTIQFSAPLSEALMEASQGSLLPWYQPPWEPGNIFSYPANLSQLQAIYPDLTQLAAGTEFQTDSTQVTLKSTWTAQSDTETDVSFNQNYSFENDLSVTSSIGEKEVAGSSLSFNLDLSGSVGFSHFTTDTTTLGMSTGILVNKPGTFRTPIESFSYRVAPYLMGTTVPGGTVDNQPLSTKLQTFGLLRAMYTANMPISTGGGTGTWWKQAYGQAPDVALNHPSRWQALTPSLSNPIPTNCLATGTGASQHDCVELNQRSPDNPSLSAFHFMRGLFVSSFNAPGQGPQLESANAGDVLTLQARVYNYSLADMPPGTVVHVRFYFTPWNPNKGVAAGPSVLINEEKPASIPKFDDLSSTPNWVLVSTKFDTGKFTETLGGGVSVMFSVLVWMEDGTGALVQEVPGHGLVSKPGTSLASFADMAALEECQLDNSCYSNNVGFYPQIFYIAGPSTAGVAELQSANAVVDISKLDVSASRITARDRILVSTTLSAVGGSAKGVSLNLYDGHPDSGGHLVAVTRIPHLAQGDHHLVRTWYRTSTCGVHQLVAVVNRGRGSEIVRRAQPVRVACGGGQ